MSLIGSRGYRPALDGMRAVSVLTIMAFHIPWSWVHGGYWSVNVFFVVSGYLITGLLLDEHRRWGRIDLMGFYTRRARRLLPAMLVLVSVVALLGRHLYTEQGASYIRGDGLAALFYAANWRLIATGQSYFQHFGEPSPFRHMWTLAIEEQYYLLFPMVLILLLKAFRRRRALLPLALGVLTLLSAVQMALLFTPGVDASRVYYGTDTRMQDILVGATLAATVWAMPQRSLKRLRRHQRALKLVAIGAAAFGLTSFVAIGAEDWTYRGGYLLFDVTFMLLILSVELAPSGMVARALSWKPLAWIGQLSYGLYLWHWPLFIWLSPERTGWNPLVLTMVRVALTCALASASFYLIENPIRRGAVRRRWGAGRATVLNLAAYPAVIAVLLVSMLGLAPPNTAAAGDTGWASRGQGTFSVLVVGDSVGFALGYYFDAARHPESTVTARVTFGCGTADQQLAFRGKPQPAEAAAKCGEQFAMWTRSVTELQPKAIVWSLGGWEVFDHVVDGNVITVGSPAYAAHLTARLEEGLTALPGTAPVMITKVPCYQQPSFVVGDTDIAPDRNDPARARAVNDVLDTFAAAHPDRVHLADVPGLLCPSGTFQEEVDGIRMRDDGVHYTQAGTARFWEWMLPQLQRLVPAG